LGTIRATDFPRRRYQLGKKVDYDGPRATAQRSAHIRTGDFEQGSLAVAGEFVYHLRGEWGKNTNEWREDEHKRARTLSKFFPIGRGRKA
jgi:hypothetical protein